MRNASHKKANIAGVNTVHDAQSLNFSLRICWTAHGQKTNHTQVYSSEKGSQILHLVQRFVS